LKQQLAKLIAAMVNYTGKREAMKLKKKRKDRATDSTAKKEMKSNLIVINETRSAIYEMNEFFRLFYN